MQSTTSHFGHCPNTFDPSNQSQDYSLPYPSVFSSGPFNNSPVSLCLCQKWQCIMFLLQEDSTQPKSEVVGGEDRLLCHLLLHMLQKRLLYSSPAMVQATKISEKAHDLQTLHLLCSDGNSVDEKVNFLLQHLPYVRFSDCEGCLVHDTSMDDVREKYTLLVKDVWEKICVNQFNKESTCDHELQYGDLDAVNVGDIETGLHEKVMQLCHMILFHPMFESYVKENARYILSHKWICRKLVPPSDHPLHVTTPVVIPFSSDQGKDDLTATPVSDGGIGNILDLEDPVAWRHSWKHADEEDLKPSLLESSGQYSNVTASELESSLDNMNSSAFSINRTSSSSCFLAEHTRDLLNDEEEDSSRLRNFHHFTKILQRKRDREEEGKPDNGEPIQICGRRIRAATETSPESRFAARSLPVARMYSMSVSWTAEELRHYRNDGSENRDRMMHYCSTSTDNPHEGNISREPRNAEETGSCGCSIVSSNSLVDINDSSVFDKEDEHRTLDAEKPHPGMRNLQTWLKDLRLHKYTYLFQSMTYERFIAVSDAWLVDNGVTVGARRKILSHLEDLRRMQKQAHELRDRLERSIGSSQCHWRSPLVSTPGGTLVATSTVTGSSQQPRPNRSSSTSCCNPWPINSERCITSSWPEDQQLCGLSSEAANTVGGVFLSEIGSPASTASSLSAGGANSAYLTPSSSITNASIPPPSEIKRWCSELRFLLISPNSLDVSLNEALFGALQLLTNFHLRASDQLSVDQMRSFLETLKLAQRCEGFNKSQQSQCASWHGRVESCVRHLQAMHTASGSSPGGGSACPPTPTNRNVQTNRNKKSSGIQRALSLSCSSSSYMALSAANNASKSQGATSTGLSRSASWKSKNSHGALSTMFRGGSISGSVNRPQGLPPFTCHVQLGATGGGVNSHLFHSPLISPSSSVSGISSSPLCTTSASCKYSMQPQLWPHEPTLFTQRNNTALMSPYSCNTGYSTSSQASSTRQPIPVIGGGSTSLTGSLMASPFLNSPVSPGQNTSISNFPVCSRRSSSCIKNFNDTRIPIIDAYPSPNAITQIPDPNAALTNLSADRTHSAPIHVSLGRGDGHIIPSALNVGSSPFSIAEALMSSNETCFTMEASPSRPPPWTLGDADCTVGSGLWEYRGNSNATGAPNNHPFGPLHRPEMVEQRGSVLFSLDEGIDDGKDTTSLNFFSGSAFAMDSSGLDLHNDLDADLARLALDVSAKGMDETC